MRKGTRDKSAGADAGFEIALGKELSVSGEDRNTRDGEFQSESASRGNLLSGRQIAANDGGAEGFVDLTVKRPRGLRLTRISGEKAEEVLGMQGL